MSQWRSQSGYERPSSFLCDALPIGAFWTATQLGGQTEEIEHKLGSNLSQPGWLKTLLTLPVRAKSEVVGDGLWKQAP